MTQTLSTTIYTGITLTAAGAYQSPFTITATGDVAPTAGSSSGVYSSLLGVTLVNDGLIDTAGNAGYGVSLTSGGYVSNNGTTAKITGNLTGVSIAGGTAGTVTNTGTITGSGSFGVQIFDSGTVTNSGSSAVITGGRAGLNLDAGTIVVTNAGMISGSSRSGVELDTNGTVTNDATGLIKGPIGVNVGYGGIGTVVNAGTISGTTYAINLGNGAQSMLVVDPGAVFIGNVVATGTGDVLALGAGTGTISGIASSGTAGSFNGFQTLAFDTGAAWTAAGAYAGLAGEVVTGFTLGDTIVLDGFGATSDTYVSGTGLELGNGTTTVTLSFTGAEFVTADFNVVDSAPNTTISTKNPCFAAGTRILTRRGEVAVEDLATGDAAVLADGTMAPITWIGHRKVQPRTQRKPETVLPVLIEAGALAVGVPCRDLLVSPDHALYLAGHLIPAKALINGATIRQVWRESVTYYHVELASHAVLLAEATPAESYLESGNRDAFANGGAAVVLHPDFAQTYRETAGYAPFSECGPVVEAVRAGILARAAIPTTDDPALTVRYRPDGSAVIVSRAAIPGNLAADPRDRRRLGVKIASIVCGGRTLALDDPALIEGWHDAEPDGRWTDGAAVIPAHLIGGELVRLTLAAATRYPVAEGVDRFVGIAG